MSLQSEPLAEPSHQPLRAQWEALKTEESGVRARDAASRLGVSEAALIASLVGERAVRLGGDLGEVLRRLPAVGEVMVLTRNEHVVHEKVGRFDHVSIVPGQHGLVLNLEIDLRLSMSQWRHGFEVTDTLKDGKERKSFQFFDAEGRAVHKVFAREGTDMAAWGAITADLASDDQSDQFEPESLPPLPADLADSEIDVKGLRAHWRAMQDTHEFFGMLKDFRVGRHQAMRLVGKEFVEQVEAASVRQMVEAASGDGTSIMCFVGNRGCIQIHTGPVKTIKIMGPWLNVLDPGFNLHLREDAIATAYIVRKPTNDGDVTSLELFDANGKNFVMFFGERKPGSPELEGWREILSHLPRV